jgi:ribosomal-protein-alanine N-acetyltransferase
LPETAVRPAARDDVEALAEMLLHADMVAWYPDVKDTERLIERQQVWLVEDAGRPVGACSLAIGPRSVARIQVCASRERGRTGEVVHAVITVLQSTLANQGVETLAFVGSDGWLLAELAAQGFERVNTILTLHKHSLRVPDRGNPDVVVRPVRPAELGDLVAIDEAAFVPLWRHTKEMFRDYQEQCNDFSVAELKGKVVGYYCLSQVGRHGHITRIAVHPRYQGQRIGVRLLAEAIAALAQGGVFGITLNTQQDNQRALRLYEWFGFRSLGQEAEVMALQLLLPTVNSGIMEL